MGCCPSNFKANNTIDGFYYNAAACSTPKRGSFKRNYSSRISAMSSASSSGISSAGSTPTKRSILSRCTPKLASSANNVNFQNVNQKDFPLDFDKLAICDDFGERPENQLEEQQQQVDNSFGYFTASLYTDSAPSTPSKSSCLIRTQDTSERPGTPSSSHSGSSGNVSADCGNLELEMYMMSNSPSLMQKTSSPISERRDVTYQVPVVKTRPTVSYQKWRNYLQTTPAYMLHNVTNIPEAIAGQFSPLSFPGFSELDEMDSAAKRYKVDVEVAPSACGGGGLTHTVISTDL